MLEKEKNILRREIDNLNRNVEQLEITIKKFRERYYPVIRNVEIEPAIPYARRYYD